MSLPDPLDFSAPPGMSLASMSLEPVGAPAAEPTAPITGRARFNIDVRSGQERRQQGERRQELRFKADRRTGNDRRPRQSWEPGYDL